MSDNLLFGIEITVGLLSYGFCWWEGSNRRGTTWEHADWVRFWELSGGTFSAVVIALGAAAWSESLSLGEQPKVLLRAFGASAAVVGTLAHFSLMWWFARGDPEAKTPW